jgi:hypothetical protein
MFQRLANELLEEHGSQPLGEGLRNPRVVPVAECEKAMLNTIISTYLGDKTVAQCPSRGNLRVRLAGYLQVGARTY